MNMKKAIFGGILATLATVILCVCLTACSTNIVGTYKFYSMKVEMEGAKIDLKVGDKFMGMIELTEDYMVLTINDDNTLTLTAMGEQATTGSWSEEDGKYYLTIAGEKQEITVSGNTLTMKEEGAEIVFKK